MPTFIGRDREVRRCYGFDEIALVPGSMTLDPDMVETSLQLGDIKLDIPFLASAMDGVVTMRTPSSSTWARALSDGSNRETTNNRAGHIQEAGESRRMGFPFLPRGLPLELSELRAIDWPHQRSRACRAYLEVYGLFTRSLVCDLDPRSSGFVHEM